MIVIELVKSWDSIVNGSNFWFYFLGLTQFRFISKMNINNFISNKPIWKEYSIISWLKDGVWSYKAYFKNKSTASEARRVLLMHEVTWYEVYLSVFTDNFVKEGISWNWLEKGLMVELFRLLKFYSCSVPLSSKLRHEPPDSKQKSKGLV